MTDVVEIHTLEVPKARKVKEDSRNAGLLNWMKFLDAKTEEELNMLAEKSPAMKKATLRLLELSADEKARQLYEARLKEQRDNYAREQYAVKQVKFEIAKNLLGLFLPVDQIVTATGLTLNEIELIREAD